MNKTDQIGMEAQPDNTAVRTALWRALHVQIDAKPPILEDEIGLQLIAPPAGWHERPDMKFTQRLRASIVARGRFIEDLVTTEVNNGINQYVILGAGLDSFAQRNSHLISKLHVFEIDQPDTLAWKEKRLAELNLFTSTNLHFVPVDFEKASWWEELLKAGFDAESPAVVVCTGVTLYLTQEAILSTMKQIATVAPGSTLAITFYLPIDLLDEEDRAMQEIAEKGAKDSGTPFKSFFSPEEIIQIGKAAGFKQVKAVSTKEMQQLYFNGRSDGLSPATGEVFLLAKT